MSKRGRLARTVFMVIAVIPFLYPFVFLVGTAVKPLTEFQQNSISLSSHPTLKNLVDAWTQAQLGPALFNSIVAVFAGVFLTVVISVFGAFWFYRHRGRIATTVKIVLIGTMAVPPPVFIIPLYVLLSNWGLSNNLLVLGVVYAAWNGSFGLYLMHAYYVQSIPDEVLEAATVDGANLFQQFYRIVVPLSKPALATLAALTFVWSWGDLLLSSVMIQDPAHRTLIVAAALLTNRFNTDIPANASAALIALVPMLLVFLILQRYLVRGISLGVGK